MRISVHLKWKRAKRRWAALVRAAAQKKGSAPMPLVGGKELESPARLRGTAGDRRRRPLLRGDRWRCAQTQPPGPRGAALGAGWRSRRKDLCRPAPAAPVAWSPSAAGGVRSPASWGRGTTGWWVLAGEKTMGRRGARGRRARPLFFPARPEGRLRAWGTWSLEPQLSPPPPPRLLQTRVRRALLAPLAGPHALRLFLSPSFFDCPNLAAPFGSAPRLARFLAVLGSAVPFLFN